MNRALARIRFAGCARIARTAALGAFVASLAGCGVLGGNPGVVYHGGMRYGPWWLTSTPIENVAIGRPPGGVTPLKPASSTKAPKGSSTSDPATPTTP